MVERKKEEDDYGLPTSHPALTPKHALLVVKLLCGLAPWTGAADGQVEVQFDLAICAMRLDDNAEAGRRLCAVYTANPAHARSLSLHGTLLVQGNEFEAAIACLTAASAFEEGAADFSIWFNLGFASLHLGNTQKALAYFQKAHHIDPGHEQAKNAMEMLAGSAYDSDDDTTGSEEEGEGVVVEDVAVGVDEKDDGPSSASAESSASPALVVQTASGDPAAAPPGDAPPPGKKKRAALKRKTTDDLLAQLAPACPSFVRHPSLARLLDQHQVKKLQKQYVLLATPRFGGHVPRRSDASPSVTVVERQWTEDVAFLRASMGACAWRPYQRHAHAQTWSAAAPHTAGCVAGNTPHPPSLPDSMHPLPGTCCPPPHGNLVVGFDSVRKMIVD